MPSFFSSSSIAWRTRFSSSPCSAPTRSVTRLVTPKGGSARAGAAAPTSRTASRPRTTDSRRTVKPPSSVGVPRDVRTLRTLGERPRFPMVGQVAATVTPRGSFSGAQPLPLGPAESLLTGVGHRQRGEQPLGVRVLRRTEHLRAGALLDQL